MFADRIKALRLRSGEAIDAQGIMTDRDFQFLIASLFVRIAKADGTISAEETSQLLAGTQTHFNLSSAEALELLTRALDQAPEPAELRAQLRSLKDLLDPVEKEEIAVLLLRLIAADGRRNAAELEVLHRAAEILEIAPEGMHRAFERFFGE